MAALANDNNSAEDSEEGSREQSEGGTGIRDWLECCRRFRELRQDWLNLRHSSKQSELMRCFQIEPTIIAAAETGEISSLSDVKSLDVCVTVHDYEHSLRTLNKFMEVLRAIEIRAYDRFDTEITFKYDANGRLQWYGIFAPELRGRQPSDCLILQNTSKTWMEALRIIQLVDNYVILPDFRSSFYAEHFRDETMNVSFISSSATYGFLHVAINAFSESRRMQMIAIEDVDCRPRQLRDKVALNSTNTTELRERLENLDPSQRQAVLGILRARCWPRAYIIHGGPGTGKSHAIVEAVVQIFKRSHLNVLVCAGPNTCADDLYEKLRAHLPGPCILRLRAGIRAREAYYGHRIVVTTNLKSFGLIGLASFDYVFIDEANHSTAPELLVPISLLKEDGCLVLAGDLYSALPNLRSVELVEMNYDKSLLERIMNFEVYKKNTESGQENGNYVTRLVQSHRGDKRIMATVNKLFYDEQIECKELTPKSLLSMLQLTSPVQFLTVRDCAGRANSDSNEGEASACVDIIIRLYKIGLEPGQLGVMSPFRLQAELIESKLTAALEKDAILLNQRYPMRSDRQERGKTFSRPGRSADEPYERDWLCKIGKIDSYHGVEREVIIISTVGPVNSIDSADFNYFVNNGGQFNLSVSRAKWLLIVVGDPDALNRGQYLRKLLASCKTGEIERWTVRSEANSLID